MNSVTETPRIAGRLTGRNIQGCCDHGVVLTASCDDCRIAPAELELTPSGEQGEKPKPVSDPFFENTEKLPPRRELEAQIEKWKRRALAFQEGYKDKSFEVTALEIQLMDLRAHGADKVTARQNESLRTKLVAACIERNEAREAVTALSKALTAAVHAMRSYQHGNDSPDLANQIDAAATAALALVDGPHTKETK